MALLSVLTASDVTVLQFTEPHIPQNINHSNQPHGFKIEDKQVMLNN
jgi:hypothetical protein